jgi:hypothetical protein
LLRLGIGAHRGIVRSSAFIGWRGDSGSSQCRPPAQQIGARHSATTGGLNLVEQQQSISGAQCEPTITDLHDGADATRGRAVDLRMCRPHDDAPSIDVDVAARPWLICAHLALELCRRFPWIEAAVGSP